MSQPSLPLTDDNRQGIFAEGETPMTEREMAEARFWFQVLRLRRRIFDDLNTALMAGAGLSVAKFDALAQLYRFRDGTRTIVVEAS